MVVCDGSCIVVRFVFFMCLLQCFCMLLIQCMWSCMFVCFKVFRPAVYLPSQKPVLYVQAFVRDVVVAACDLSGRTAVLEFVDMHFVPVDRCC